MSYGEIYFAQLINPQNLNTFYVSSWKNAIKIPYQKYTIKETDFRVKTATFTTRQQIDLTTGVYAVLINSKYHENFSGIILDRDYDEDTGFSTYQCQDWSRKHMLRDEYIANNAKLYYVIRQLLTNCQIPLKPSDAQLTAYKPILKGLRALGKYEQSLYDGNIYKGNPLNQTISLISRNKTYMELIRSLIFNCLGYFDIWWNQKGVLQIEPISKKDWEDTGLVLSDGGYYDRKFKFSTTNAITGVTVNGSDLTSGTGVSAKSLTGLDVATFFGNITASTNNPNKNTSNAVAKKTTTTTNKKTTTATKNKYDNPFNNKARRVWVNADEGSNAMKNALVKQLQKAGWKVHPGKTWREAHYYDYWNVTNKYSVYVTIYNGICPGLLLLGRIY